MCREPCPILSSSCVCLCVCVFGDVSVRSSPILAVAEVEWEVRGGQDLMVPLYWGFCVICYIKTCKQYLKIIHTYHKTYTVTEYNEIWSWMIIIVKQNIYAKIPEVWMSTNEYLNEVRGHVKSELVNICTEEQKNAGSDCVICLNLVIKHILLFNSQLGGI